MLERIEKPNDIKNIDHGDLDELAQDIRDFLIEKISVTGGHLGSNLGTVELTMALHLALDLPKDKIVWDVGHQSYTHKLLTGRKDGFDTLRQFHGMSGFPKRRESEYDAFDTGHSSTSISAGLGLVKARDLSGGDETIVSVIGDGSLTGGMAYEALNNASKLRSNMIIILNDNNMSISENVGGVSNYLNDIRTGNAYQTLKADVYKALIGTRRGDGIVNRIRKAKSGLKHLIIPGMFFEDMGIMYLGPVDGHNIDNLVRAINDAKRFPGAVLIHAITQKGKGFGPAERHPARFHGAEPFDIETGLPTHHRTEASYTDVFATVMCKLGERNPKVVAITAAMPDGTGLKRFHNMYPDRFFDVGIAEEHAVTFAAGLAAGGMKPVVAIYSSFLQRAYDQIIHDVCIQNLPVIFAVDRAGLVGNDGETHQGIFDLSFLSMIPNMVVCAPKNKWELSDMMKFAVNLEAPIAIRYPRGIAYAGLEEFRAPIELGKGEWIYKEDTICLLAIGSMVKTSERVRELLKEKGYNVSLVNARFANPIDKELVRECSKTHKLIVTLEENVARGGFGEAVCSVLDEEKDHIPVCNITLPDEYIEHGNVDLLKQEIGLDPEGIVRTLLEIIERDINQ